MTVAPIFSGLLIGRGCDSAIGKTYAQAIDYEPTQILENATGQSTEAFLEQVDSSEKLAHRLNVSASASFSRFGFSASAETNYIAEQEINSFNTYLLVCIRVRNPEKVIRNPRLKPEAEKLLREAGWEAFEKTYGPEYMSGVITGGSYYGLIQIKTDSREEQRKIAVAVSFSGWGAKAKVKLEDDLKEATKGKETKITVLQSGGSGDSIEVTLEDMIQQAINFPEVVKNAPVAYQGIFEAYRDSVPLPPAIGGSPLDRQLRLDTLEELGRKYLFNKDYRSNLSYILDGHLLDFEEYQSLAPQERQQKQENFQKDFEGITNQINELVKLAGRCREAATACELPGKYYQTIEPLPKIDGQNMMLKKMEEEIAKLRQQVDLLQDTLNISNGNIGVGIIPESNAKLAVRGATEVFGLKYLKTTKDARIGVGDPGKTWSMAVGWANQGDFSIIEELAAGDRLYIKQGGNVGIGTTTPVAKLDVNGDINANGNIRIKGVAPFKIGEYTFAGGSSVNTGYPVSDWVATIASFRALQGDIEENDTGDIIQILPYPQNGTWWIYADFRSHNRNETWTVYVLFIRRELVG